MNQHTARHGPRAMPGDEAPGHPRARRPERNRAGRPQQPPAGDPAGEDGPVPGGPDEDEFELAGGDDLGAAELGPAAPGFTDPDAPSGQVRK